MKIGRNKPCPCGSGKKYKKCCGNPLKMAAEGKPASRVPPAEMKQIIDTMNAQELTRQQQQGLGRPIISAEVAGYRMVAIGNEVRFSKNWKVFPDFLGDYLKHVLGDDWGRTELAKLLAERHPVMQWYDKYCAHQKASMDESRRIQTMPAAAVVTCYLNLAYNLYLLKHNVELQERLVRRLRDAKQFQGAYYELIVANCLIRAGFNLELEDEADDEMKHCEFSAVSQMTQKKYWVEAKMRGVAGVLAKTKVDGSTGRDPTEKLTTHLREALQKPAADDRLIFLDVNAPTAKADGVPAWANKATKRLDDRERSTPTHQTAYVFVTNMCFHHHLDDPNPQFEAMAYGLNIPDFAKPGYYRLTEMYKAKQRHIDGHRIMDAFQTYPKLPVTFDGKVLSESSNSVQAPVQIGQTYFFEDVEGGITGTVTTATVSEGNREVVLAVRTNDGRQLLLAEKMTDEQLAEYREHRDTYFGVVLQAGREAKTPYELFEVMVSSYANTPKDRLCELSKDAPDAKELSLLSRDELALALCERWTMSVVASAERQKVTRGHATDSTGQDSD